MSADIEPSRPGREEPGGLLKRRGRGRSLAPLTLGALAGVVACVLLVGVLYALRGQTPSPRPVAETVCTDLSTQRYGALYELLSPSQQTLGTRAQFVVSQQDLDILHGKVVSCSVGAISSGANPAIVQLSVRRANSGQGTGKLTLVLVGQNWRVDAYTSTII